jgi:hypothetical protein
MHTPCAVTHRHMSEPVQAMHLPVHHPGAPENSVPELWILQNTAVLVRQHSYGVFRCHRVAGCRAPGDVGYRAPCD